MLPHHAVIDVPDAAAAAEKDVKAPLLDEKAPVPAAVAQVDASQRRSNAAPTLALLLATAVLLGLASLHMYGSGCPHHAAANQRGNNEVAAFLAKLETSLTEKAVAANEFGFAYESNITDANLKCVLSV
ncbi:hypothetical protein AMAG_05592 [Allomyces macrogynus ATCC 38327]|uniref:Uncharacterized protein n=1 Tax=Allomyces macrogynus (strain ATCC 38327) TaxID=578462 RepID=A0A0L0SC93_ALLM3|nr:hypothetical protein AMAG_05592 [Allomyces macrogynus ATCC 38327]|eukprot:KNE60173.1 hypothetical protein AMAG_05592 [Allomyces macrogynus ATCC 38327]